MIFDFLLLEDQYYQGRRPNGIYIPRYRNIDAASRTTAFLRGYGYQGGAERAGWGRGATAEGFGADFKESLLQPGGWTMTINGFGECLPVVDALIQMPGTDDSDARLNGLAGRITGALNALAEDQVKGGES